ncbi:MAG: glycosyltransferase [Nanoarchaeota archaeon]|nr:glycosyltransferase [Nanoarchaeota archaeon]
MAKPMVSIIIRTKNEERWIGKCLSVVFNQDFKDFEVILVDSGSQDRTIEKAKQFPVKVVNYDDKEFKPGKAINEGIKVSTGNYIAILSGHCIPTNNQWLSNLVREIEVPEVAGVYGKQEPLPFSSDLDKRDLLTVFGLDRKIQTKDTFFHNANSLIKKSVWQEISFDEEVLHIEDRIWAKEVLKRGYKIVYTPEASVYHYHGINQNANPKRAKEIVEILEKLEPEIKNRAIDISQLKVAGVIPAKGKVEYLGGRPLIEYTILRAFDSKYLNLIAVTTDNPEIADIARNLGVQHIFIYPPELTDEHVEIKEVLKYAVSQFEKMEIIPDIISYLSPTYPFRPKKIIDEVIKKLMNEGYDSVLPVLPEYRSSWIVEEGKIKRLDQGFVPSKFKQPLYTGLSGLVTASYVDIIKKGQDRLGERVGMVELDNLLYYIDIGKAKGKELAEMIIKDWWLKNQ